MHRTLKRCRDGLTAIGVILLTMLSGCAEPSDVASSRQSSSKSAVAPPATQPEISVQNLPAPTPLVHSGKLLLMHYMPWYQTPAVRGKWGSHWKGHQSEHNPDQRKDNGLPDIWSHYHPLIGLYDSTDPELLECHLLQMRFAGIDGVIVDWYGLGQTADFPPIHDATQAMFAATAKFGMKFSVCYEDRTVKLMNDWDKLKPEQNTEHLVQMLRWMDVNWFNQPQYVRVGDRPLVLNFGPIVFKDPAPWNTAFNSVSVRPMFFALHHLWRKAGADGGFTWIHRDAFENPNDLVTIRRRMHETFNYPSKNPEQVLISAYPGYHDVYAHNHWAPLDHRGGQTMRDTLEAGMTGPWKIIQLVTWNDYGEGTIIEPTHEFGYTFLDVIQMVRKRELGDQLKYTPEDLRLPARLYALRKSGAMPAGKMEPIAQLLRAGKCQQARELMDRLQVPPVLEPTPSTAGSTR